MFDILINEYICFWKDPSMYYRYIDSDTLSGFGIMTIVNVIFSIIIFALGMAMIFGGDKFYHNDVLGIILSACGLISSGFSIMYGIIASKISNNGYIDEYDPDKFIIIFSTLGAGLFSGALFVYSAVGLVVLLFTGLFYYIPILMFNIALSKKISRADNDDVYTEFKNYKERKINA